MKMCQIIKYVLNSKLKDKRFCIVLSFTIGIAITTQIDYTTNIQTNHLKTILILISLKLKINVHLSCGFCVSNMM